MSKILFFLNSILNELHVVFYILFFFEIKRLQEVILDHSEKDNENGRIPRSIECELTEDLTDTCSPGKSYLKLKDRRGGTRWSN